MKTKAVRIYGVQDLRLEEFELPDMKEDEILARVVSDSICMSSHKLAMQGGKHKRVRYDLTRRPAVIGHEFCGIIEKVGAKWADRFTPGTKFAIQPALNYPDAQGQGTLWAPGYSYEYIGGDATYIIIPSEVMEMNCLLPYTGDNFYLGSLAEPVSCIAGAFHAQYHTREGSYNHSMGIAEGGSAALLAGVGPMGLGAIDYAVHNPRKPSRLVVTDIDDGRLARAARLLSVEEARKQGVELIYVNTKDSADPVDHLKSLNRGKLFDDVFVFAPVKPVLELGDNLLGHDGCLNFFAGPTDPGFSAAFNFYNVHYEAHHIVGTSGGNTDDMNESLSMMAEGTLNPVFMVTHIGGLNAVVQATLDLDKIPGGKKLIYTHKKLDLTAIDGFEEKGKTDPFYRNLGEICAKHQGLWNKEAEEYLLANAPDI
ncbi:MAG: zinc-binding dehydrogenase [Spirochaetaceae bacterium]|jgi:threonine dehydrogenase-like Zn-dependent dehydrogenase|nr:zinc-binding dehydrogenase [Spirochaetaceae bacterium]